MKPLLIIAIVLSVIAVAAVWGQSSVEKFEPVQPTWSRLVTVTNFPNPQNVAGTVSVGNLPAVQQVEVVNFPPTAGAARFQLVGFTAATFTGGAGVFGFTDACQLEFPGSRMCDLTEALTTTQLPDLSIGASSAWTFMGGQVSTDQNCWGWSSNVNNARGITMTKQGKFGGDWCDRQYSVACCAPVQ